MEPLKLYLAPIAGYTNSAFRQICKEFGADVVYTEMISAAGIFYKSERTHDICKFEELERPIIFQLFGDMPEHFEKAIKILAKQYRPDGFDINMGCPAPKIVKGGGGASLFKKPKLARSIIETCIKTTELPISIKIRSSAYGVQALDFLKKIKGLKLSAIAVHGRDLKQRHSGQINFETLKEVGEKIPKLFGNNCKYIVNGGIDSIDSCKEMIEKTGCKNIMLAQGAMNRLWIFSEIKSGENIEFSSQKRVDLAKKHAKLYLLENDNLIPLRKHLHLYFKGLPKAAEIRSKLVRVTTLKDLENACNEFLNIES